MELRNQIQEKGLKFNWVAEKVGVSKTMFSFYMTGTRTMPTDVKKKVKELLA